MIRLVIVLLLGIAWLDGHTQSSLPPCPTDPSATWTDCFGTATLRNGTQYIGSFKNDQRVGQGTLISRKGFTLVEGSWLDDSTVDSVGGRWRVLGVTDEDVWFVLMNSIRSEGAFRRVWVMNAYSEPHPTYRWLSGRELSRFDCSNERYQTIQATVHAGSWGSGDILHSFDESEWKYFAPGTAYERIGKYVCKYNLAK